jgi:Spx/MgsR family transcriptional regulator
MSKTVKLYGLPYCDGTIAVTKWLEAKGYSINLHNYKTDGIAKEKLAEWTHALGWEKVLNKRSTTWRSLQQEEQDKVVNESAAIDIMLKNTSLIKRPVIEFEKELNLMFFKHPTATMKIFFFSMEL